MKKVVFNIFNIKMHKEKEREIILHAQLLQSYSSILFILFFILLGRGIKNEEWATARICNR